jgi:hypothetical protein
MRRPITATQQPRRRALLLFDRIAQHRGDDAAQDVFM